MDYRLMKLPCGLWATIEEVPTPWGLTSHIKTLHLTRKGAILKLHKLTNI